MEKIKDYTHGGNVHKASKELSLKKSDILDFSANINPLGLSPKGIFSILMNLRNILNYPDPAYSDLTNSLAQFYDVNSDDILLGNGAIELIYSYVRLNKVGRALIPGPGFVEYEKALRSNGWDISIYDNHKNIDLTGFDVIFICNPNNPTGKSYSESCLLDILDRSQVSNTDVFLDEAFIDYSSYNSMSNYIEQYDNLYILKSLTKFFAIPGLRLGGLLTTNIGFKQGFYRNLIPWSINSVVEDYIIAALKDSRFIKSSKRYVKIERLWLYKKLLKLDQLKVFRSQGNYIMFRFDSNIDLVHRLRCRGLLIRSCSNYNNLDSTYYRVAVKKRLQNRVLLKELKNILAC